MFEGCMTIPTLVEDTVLLRLLRPLATTYTITYPSAQDASRVASVHAMRRTTLPLPGVARTQIIS